MAESVAIDPTKLQVDPRQLGAVKVGAGRAFGHEFRKRLKLYYDGNLTSLAKDTGLDYPFLYKVKHGLRLPGIVALRSICERLRLKLHEAILLYPNGKVPRRGRPRGAVSELWFTGRERFAHILEKWIRQHAESLRPDDDTAGQAAIDSPDEFCAATGFTYGHFMRLMRAKRALPSFKMIDKMAAYCGKKPFRLIALKIATEVPVRHRHEVLRRLLPDEIELLVDTRADLG